MPIFYFENAYDPDPLNGSYEAENETALIERLFPNAVDFLVDERQVCRTVVQVFDIILDADENRVIVFVSTQKLDWELNRQEQARVEPLSYLTV